jgi:NADH-quinone oxidoreductase subunit C
MPTASHGHTPTMKCTLINMASPTSVLAPHIDAFLAPEAVHSLHDYVADKLAKSLVSTAVAHKEVTLQCTPEALEKVLTFLRDDKRCQFTQVMDICGADYLGKKLPEQRFEVVYHLLSLSRNQRVRVKVSLPEDAPHIPTITGLWAGAGWYEREAFDMYGIIFTGHPDLRRILTDYGFEGYPLRKDFPLNGFVETYFDTAQNRVAYKPVDLPQDLRRFDKISEWQGATGNARLADTDNVFDESEFK